MLLERYGLWDGAARASGVILARDAAAARAVPDAAARAAIAAPRRAFQRARCRRRRAARARARGAGSGTHVRRRDPRAAAARRRLRPAGSRSHDRATSPTRSAGAQGPAAGARARETLPAMLLFVVSALVVFHCTPGRRLRPGGRRAALGRDRLHRAARARARSCAEREQGCSTRSCSRPCDRAAIWVARRSRCSAFLALAEVVALPAFALFFTDSTRETIAGVALAELGICAVGTLARRDGGRRPGAGAAPAASLPAAGDPDRRRRRRCERRRRARRSTWHFSRCTTPSLRSCAGLPLSTWSRNNPWPRCCRAALAALSCSARRSR